jgi:DNA-binding CsgD family transcriptional regulator
MAPLPRRCQHCPVVSNLVSATWPLVGRDAELAVLASALADGNAGGVVLFGAAGVGKTRLARCAVDMAEARGLVTASVRANRSASLIPFGALAPLFAELGLPVEVDARLLRAAADAVRQRRGEGRMLLAVDDAQELDDASGALLDHLLHTGDVQVVLTARLGDQQAAAIHDMWKDGRIIRLEVHPLPDRHVQALTSLALGGPVEASTLQVLSDSCAGNVLFLRELINGALESGALEEHQGMWRLSGSIARSPRLRDLIERRLRGISPVERGVLELVAVGEPLRLSFLKTLVDSRSVEHLERREILDSERGDGDPVVRFNHPLFGEVVREHLSPVRKAHLSRDLADAAEVVGTADERSALRTAVWRLDGGGTIQPDLTLAAARKAFLSEDYLLSGRLARSVWDTTSSLPAALLVADSYDLSGRYTEIEDLLVAATPQAADDVDRTEVATRRASTLFRLPAGSHRADQVLDDAMAAITDPACRRRLVSQQANHLLLAGDVSRAIDLIAGVLDQRGDSPLALASRDYGVALALAGRTRDAIRHTDEGLAACLDLEEEGQLTAAAVFVVAQALAQCESGHLAAAGDLASAAYETTIERRNPDGQAWFASILGLIRCAEGRLVTAGHFFREAASCYERLGHPGQRWSLGGLALAAGQMGDALAAEAAIARLDDLPPTTMTIMDVGIRRGRAWASVAAGRLTQAAEELQGAVDMAESWGQWAGAAAASHDLLRLGGGIPVARRIEELSDQVDGDLMLARTTLAGAVVAGSADRAAEATDQFESVGAFLFAAEAATLEQRLASEAGLSRRVTAAAARAAALLGRCESPQTPGLTARAEPAPLTPREREIATLAADGLSSRQIGEALFVSSRTVDNHLQRIYTKLGVSSRQQLRQRWGG